MTGNDSRTPEGEVEASAARPDLLDLSTDQLRQLLQSELERRESAGRLGTSTVPVTGRFSRWDGVAGWLESLLRGQPLYGRGSIAADAGTITMQGWQRTWLGLPVERVLPVAVDRVRSVARIGTGVYLEIARRAWFSRKVEFEADPQTDTNGFLGALPTTKTAALSAKRQELWLFERTLRERCLVAWVTPLFVLLSVLGFVVPLALSGFVAPGLAATTYEFANVPGLVLAGQWWRLATALFLHAGLVHLALNMWALWSIGRLTERLYGQGRYFCAYILAGLIGGLVSIAWDPTRWSIGASGAIFGVFGAFLAYLGHPATQVPRAIMRAHWLPNLLFVVFNLLVGAFQQGVDNAAHVGGLLAGLALGVALTPTSANKKLRTPWAARLAALALLVGGGSAALGFSGALDQEPPLNDRFAIDHPWYVPGEARNLAAWQRLAGMSAAGVMSQMQLAEGFRTDILPFWAQAQARLLNAASDEAENERDYRLAVAEYAQLRLDLVKAIVEATSGKDAGGQKAAELAQEIPKRLARIERLALISRMENDNAGLSRRLRLATLRSTPGASDCVRSPYIDVMVADTDSRTDLPYLSDVAACRSQELFVANDFAALEALFETAGTETDFTRKISMAPLRSGLLNFFEFGPHDIEANLRRLIKWRREFPESTLVGPLEAELFSAWAWQARGAGSAREVNPLQWELYGFRTEMAKAALDAEVESGRRSPLWYQAWFDVSIDTIEREDLLAKHAEAQALYPRYYSLQRGVIRTLLPRWRGSDNDVLTFIDDQIRNAPETERDELYARLMWTYADADGDQTTIYQYLKGDNWDKFQRGFTTVLERNPESDYALNVFARIACAADSREDYRRLRPQLESRKSATAWTIEATLESCDAKLPALPE